MPTENMQGILPGKNFFEDQLNIYLDAQLEFSNGFYPYQRIAYINLSIQYIHYLNHRK